MLGNLLELLDSTKDCAMQCLLGLLSDFDILANSLYSPQIFAFPSKLVVVFLLGTENMRGVYNYVLKGPQAFHRS